MRGLIPWVCFLCLCAPSCVGGFNPHDGGDAGQDADVSHDASSDVVDGARDADDGVMDADDGGHDGDDAGLDADEPDTDLRDADGADGDRDVVDVGPDSDHDPDVEVDVDVPECAPSLTGGVLAWYDFEGDLSDETGAHDAVLHDPDGCLSYIDGPAHCGQGLFFSGGCDETWVEIAHSPAWDDVMSIDFWLWQNPAGFSGILSRDASGTDQPGHITVAIDDTGLLYVRLQRAATMGTLVCSDGPLTDATWMHVGINLGFPGVEIWIDGEQQAGTDSVRIGGVDIPCAGALGGPYGIDGNENPWVIGGMTWDSEEGVAEPVTFLADATAVDQLRLSASRQDFSASP